MLKTMDGDEERCQRLLAAAASYVMTVAVENGVPARTSHGEGCLAITGHAAGGFENDPGLWQRLIPEEDRPAALAQVATLLKGETPPPVEHRITHKQGSVRWVRNTSVPRMDAAGRVIGYDGLITDITAQKEVEEKLKQAYAELAKREGTLRRTLRELHLSHHELKEAQMQLIQAGKLESVGRLAAGVAHEVKNPLQTLLLGLSYLANKLPNDDQNIALVMSNMEEAIHRADGIVRELLQLSAGTPLEVREEDLNGVIEQALWLMNYELIAARVTVVRELDEHLPRVLLDKRKMEQVFINLFMNAAQAMPQGGTLTVRTRGERLSEAAPGLAASPNAGGANGAVVIAEVQDTGRGIPAQNLSKLFQPYFTTKPIGVGTGLGLSVIKNIVELHKGTIDVRNAPEGGVRATLILKVHSG